MYSPLNAKGNSADESANIQYMLAYQSIAVKKEEKSESTVEKEVATTTTNPLAEKNPPQMSAYLVETIIIKFKDKGNKLYGVTRRRCVLSNKS